MIEQENKIYDTKELLKNNDKFQLNINDKLLEYKTYKKIIINGSIDYINLYSDFETLYIEKSYYDLTIINKTNNNLKKIYLNQNLRKFEIIGEYKNLEEIIFLKNNKKPIIPCKEINIILQGNFNKNIIYKNDNINSNLFLLSEKKLKINILSSDKINNIYFDFDKNSCFNYNYFNYNYFNIKNLHFNYLSILNKKLNLYNYTSYNIFKKNNCFKINNFEINLKNEINIETIYDYEGYYDFNKEIQIKIKGIFKELKYIDLLKENFNTNINKFKTKIKDLKLNGVFNNIIFYFDMKDDFYNNYIENLILKGKYNYIDLYKKTSSYNIFKNITLKNFICNNLKLINHYNISFDNIKINNLICITYINYISDIIKYCKKLYILNSNFNKLPELFNLEELKIEGNNINFLSNTLINLKKLTLIDCNNIKELPDNLLNIKSLYLYNCNNINSIPYTYIKLKELEINECNNLKNISNIFNLKKIKINNCNNIINIPNTLINLKDLNINQCDKINSLPNTIINLKYLNINQCDKINSLPNTLIKLKDLKITKCNNIKFLNCLTFYNLKNIECDLKLINLNFNNLLHCKIIF